MTRNTDHLHNLSIWDIETIMNRVNNWLFVTFFFLAIALGVMMFTDQPAIAWAFAAPALVSVCMALIRYEDYRKAVDIGYGATA